MEQSQHGERIAAAESDLKTLAVSVGQLADLMRREHESTALEIKALGVQIGSIGRANWPTYIAGIGIILTLGAAALGPIWLRQNSVEVSVSKITDAVHDHSLLPIHPVAAMQLQSIERRLELLETKGTK